VEVWQVALHSNPSAGIVALEGLGAALPIFSASSGCSIVLLNSSTGEQLWQLDLDAVVENLQPFGNDSLIYNDDSTIATVSNLGKPGWVNSDLASVGIVGVTPTSSKDVVALTMEPAVYKIDSSGILRWKCVLPGDGGTTSPTFMEPRLIVTGTDPGTLNYIDRDGNLLQTSQGLPNFGTPIASIRGGIIYLPYATGVICHDLIKGEQWRLALNSRLTAEATLSANDLLIAPIDMEVIGIDVDGEIRWTHKPSSPVAHKPILDREGNCYVSTTEGTVYSLDTSGKVRWSQSLHLQVLVSPCLVNGVFIVAAQGGIVVGLASLGY
jgi:outer membrane protein assembly factor BamB